jgi:hypothetical protein
MTTDETEPGTQVGTQVDNQTDTQSAAGGYPAGDWVDLKTAADLLGVSMNTIRRRRKAGELPGSRLEPSEKGERWLVPRQVIDELRGVATQPGTQVDTQPGGDAAALRSQIADLQRQLQDREREAERERAAAAQIATELRHQVELQTLRADSHEQIALERLRVLGTQEIALQLAQRKVLELETATAKRRRGWLWSKRKTDTTPQAAPSVIQDTQQGS